ncbi:chromate efflux transporter [Veronia pacifica]|uniref:Chorismate-binding protein n=1 Tax=Veronia pacifica TaxID=1080227 RepID=A0A1C3EKJ2_9GAMM|nr:chromate efflux transporter [Veronia pacifica]ODA33748.1 chorismate-binding protein [Veronia pacifica]
MFEVFYRFLLLGCMSFGGPVAHIGYFQREFVDKRKWLSDEEFASALSLCQFLPGPASSQMGMYIGHNRAGFSGALMAFIGFTLPSAVLLTLLAVSTSSTSGDAPWLVMSIGAAKLLAVVVVADAIWTMGKKFVHSFATVAACILTAVWILWQSGLVAQLMPIIMCGVVGALFLSKKPKSSESERKSSVSSSLTIPLFIIFALLLILPVLLPSSSPVNVFHYFYQAGSFVFGGGHVVLPLLQPIIGDSVTGTALVEGYAAAQLVPGPMFTVASYVGASFQGVDPYLGSFIATLAIFLPGALLLFAAMPVWQKVMLNPAFAGAVTLINAAVVGLLLAALYQPVWISAVNNISDIVVVSIAFLIMRKYQFSVFWLLAAMLVYKLVFSMIL